MPQRHASGIDCCCVPVAHVSQQLRRSADTEARSRSHAVGKMIYEERNIDMDHLDAYAGFAEVYDFFMKDIPYEKWADYVTDILKENGISDGLVLELGCGTGTFTRLLAQKGYDMIGVDNSVEMLEVARNKTIEAESDILWLLQDMRSFELYGTVRAIVSVCDSMNYITTLKDLQMVFSLVNNYLDPGGVFLFDMKTPYYYREVMGDRVIAETEEEASYIWENSYYEDDMINEYDLTFFIRQENGLYRRCSETHLQRAFGIETVLSLLKKAGLHVEAVYAEGTHEEPRPDSERIYFIARECTK